MFENLSFTNFTWKREPILYITLAVAILNVIGTLLAGDVEFAQAIETIVLLVFGFFARGQVSPIHRQ